MSAPSPLLLKLALRLLGSLKIPVDRRRIRERGFVLPVAILIVLVLSLVTVGLLTRSTQRNIQTQVERAGQTVSRQLNAAIDRARAKIDYLVRDPRLPAGAPTDAQLASALLNDGSIVPAEQQDPYTLPDENRFLLRYTANVPDSQDPVERQSPAWWFLVDTDNNGVNDSVTAYTILHNRRAPVTGQKEQQGFETNISDTERAHRLLIRSGPLQGSVLTPCTHKAAEQTANPNVGDWFQAGSALYKPFQVFAVTLPIQGADSTTRAISALQFQQDQRRDLLNKWGAFSRGDLEFFFTPPYNWNGAIYAGGSLFFRYRSTNSFRAFTISSEQSCFYMPVDNSEITAFGELVAGAIGYAGQEVSDSLVFDVHSGEQDVAPRVSVSLNNLNFDSVQNTVEPESVALDPLELHLFGRIRTRGNYQQDAGEWAKSPLNAKKDPNPGRIKAGGFQASPDQVCPPYVDDVYRADNRFGPKASYERPPVTPDPQKGCNVPTFAEKFNARAGDTIPSEAKNELGESLTEDNPPAGALAEVGLDGYWERRARVEGLRVIVGQRLELTRTDSLPLPLVPPGDPNDPDPDPTKLQAIFISNEARQRLTLRDNPAAVQATAVYHYSHQDGRFPIACLATVAHPGTPWSLQRASTFPAGDQTNQLGINFFTGEGTNVWEYDPEPMKDWLRPGTPLWTALTNLANFAGDPDGAYPPKQEAGRIHPDPFITAFGNFSELRRVIDTVNNGTPVEELSLADQTTLQTAGCMLGMLADNILRIWDKATGSKPDPEAQILWKDIKASRKGKLDDPERNRFYLPLRYIFPDTTENNTDFFDDQDPLESERRDAYKPFDGESWVPEATYRALCDPRNSGCNLEELDDLKLIRLQPRKKINEWVLPRASTSCPNSTLLGGNHPNSNQMELIRVVGDQCYRVPFKDSVFYDGREAMAVRALNIDLALLTNNVPGQDNGLINGDTWLPAGVQEGREGGIFYAFREDAVREDAIARPPLTNFAAYQTAWQAANARGTLASVMNAGQPGRNQPVGDPPVSNEGLSPKPVDYYPDPDRRPYGFRLRNGAVLARGGFNLDEAVFGLSFVSDNPVYIQGDFNLHRTRGGDPLEEFKTLLNFGSDGLYSNFYGRLRRNEDRRFARAAEDLWRPTEIIGDSINILSADFCDGSIDDGFVQDGTLNGGGSSFVANRDYQGNPQRASAPRRNDYYGCSGPNLGANTSFLNQALVIRGNNWPAPDPNNNGAGVLRFDNTNGAQNLGDNTNQPGWPDVFARDTLFARRDSTDPNSNEADRTVGRGVPEVRQLRAPDRDYANFGVRISALGNPVLDTSRWVMVAPIGPCPNPGGAGLLAEYYNGWITSPRNQYDPNTGFASTGAVGPLLSNAQNKNLPYLRAVRWPDPVFPAQGVPDAIGQYNNGYTSSAPRCNVNSNNNNERWACVRDAIDDPSKLELFARSGPGFPSWGGFQYQFGSSTDLNSRSPFKRRLYNKLPECNDSSSLSDILQPLCRLSVPLPPASPDRRDRGDWFWMPSCGEPDGNNGFTNLLTDADELNFPSGFNFWRSCWRRRSGVSGSGNNNGNDFFVVRWVGELYPRWPGLQSYHILDGDDGVRLIIRRREGSDATFGVPDGSPLSLGPNAAGAEAWSDGSGKQVTLRLELECAPAQGPSPYLVEIQTYENTGTARLRFATRDGSDQENYDLRYLKPLEPKNKPCLPSGTPANNQALCSNPTPTPTPPPTRTPTLTPTPTRTPTPTPTPPPIDTFVPDAPGKSPLGEWMAAKPNTVELRPVGEVQAEPEPETISVHDVAQVADEGVTIALEPRLSPVLEVKAGVPKPPKWPNPAEALQAAFNWIFGEPAHAARNGLKSNLLLLQIANPSKEPGIRPAESNASPPPIAGDPAPGGDGWARRLRRRLLNKDPNDLKVRCDSEEKVGPDGGFWVPGVFRPNFNDRFRYEAYTGRSRPSTLRTNDGNDPTFIDLNNDGVLDPGETNVVDRDPLFGVNLIPENPGNPIQLEIQPQMALNPYARVKDAAAQGYRADSKYADGYYIDDRGDEDSEKIRNGLCFYVKPNGNTIQVQIDRNGGDNDGLVWVDVEPFTLDLNKPTTGFAGNNPVLGVILDEVTRRPIPIPHFQELASTTVSQRRRSEDGSQNWQLQPARETRVNAVAVSGVLPSRLHQTAGGMHNFLRLNEMWRGTNLFFSGSMIQLNYSTYATGPFLQHSFEPPNLVQDSTFVRGYDYYFPPRRRFGYDVGLQIARRPGAVSSRFQFPSNARTEFLRELDPQDPYVRRLRCALQDQPDVPLDPSAQIGGCNEFN
ncbi:hormogonium polysaccharide biosynthesis protein HpsA [Synechococcus sp. H60.2]|uniref:hormogonium polysaccharide biosynthesis protein HpsA n=1 Tax=Synechococcus sp. H60.2 TaxID=2964518 RepID=UPI0039C2C91A